MVEFPLKLSNKDEQKVFAVYKVYKYVSLGNYSKLYEFVERW